MTPTSPDSSRWKLIDQILDELLDGSASQRETILRNRCGADAGLRLEVEKLLAATERAADFMEVSAVDSASRSLDLEATGSLIGRRVGKYRLLKLIGSGGMGKVFLASRTDKEFRKTVAVKLVNPFWNDDEMAHTFRRERQILAKLEHPNIARLLDGGTTKDKVSFLVMEYVEGVPITEYCRDKCKTANERLKIFLKVCEAVKFAHQNLISHRDLKPNNILVTADGTVKLLDFGVAKLLQPDLLDVSSNFTLGTNILTPNYASPEQLMGETITTASDVYSLGVLLYELLCGNRPHDLKDKSLPEILRIISQEVPPKPSETGVEIREQVANAALSASGLHSRTSARRALRGDLDNICLKALAKERSERYQTVEELSADINRHLATLPILARQPSAWYRMNKYVKRHRLGVAGATLIMILVLGWLTSAVWQRNVARSQADQNLRRAYAADMNLGMQAYETANLTRLNNIVARYQNTAFTNNWEYRFLQNLAKPKGQLLMIPHPSEVWDVTFSPDSKRMATACADGFARIYQVPEGKLLTTTATKEINIWRVRFSPDGRFLATASGDAASTSVKVWSAATGAETLSLVGHTARVRGVDFSPDGKMIATGSRDGTIRIWSAADGRELRKLVVGEADQTHETEDLHFTPDGAKMIAASRNPSGLWEVASGRIVFKFDGGWSTAAVSPDGKRFALAGGPKIQIFNASPVKQVLEIARHEAKINNLGFSPDGLTIASASSDRTVKFSDAQTGAELRSLKTHVSEAWSVAFSRNGKFIATSGTDFKVFLFDAAELLQPSSFAFALNFGGGWSAISPDRSKVVLPGPGLSQDATYSQTLWDVKSKRQGAEFSTKEAVYTASFSPDGAIVATGGRAGTITLWNSATGAEIRHFADHDKYIVSVVFTPDGKRLISASHDQTVRVWNVENPVGFRELCHFDAEVSALEVSPDGHRVFVASLDTTAKLIDFETGRVIAAIGKLRKPFLSVAFAPDGQTFATGDSDGAIQIRQTADAKLLATFTGNAGHLTGLTYSPDGLRLASASGEGVIRLWDTKTGDQVLAIRTGSPETSFLAFTPDGNTLISYGAGGKIQLWEAAPH
jgi:WD40 repeat protein/serine/threonine protein kinase